MAELLNEVTIQVSTEIPLEKSNESSFSGKDPVEHLLNKPKYNFNIANQYQFENINGKIAIKFTKHQIGNILPYEWDSLNSIYYEDLLTILKHGTRSSHGKIDYESETFKLPLKEHQRRTLYEMISLEETKERYTPNFNFGVLSDKVGSGKSACILALIDKYPTVKNTTHHILNNHIPEKSLHNWMGSTFSEKDDLEFYKANVIVIPHGLFNQWIGYIKKFTNLNCYGINNRKNIEAMTVDTLNNYPIILVKSTMFSKFTSKVFSIYSETKLANLETIDNYEYRVIAPKFNPKEKVSQISAAISTLRDQSPNGLSIISDSHLQTIKQCIVKINEKLNDYSTLMAENPQKKNSIIISNIMKYKKGPIFQRVIFDEANSISISNCPMLLGRFNWFITSSILDMAYPTGYFKNDSTIAGIKHTGFIRKSFDLACNSSTPTLIPHFMIKNMDNYIDASFSLPDPIITIHQCFTPPEYLILKETKAVDNDVLVAIQGGDLNKAVEALGCNHGVSEGDLLQRVISGLELKRKTLELDVSSKKASIENNVPIRTTLLHEIDQLHEQCYPIIQAHGLTLTEIEKDISKHLEAPWYSNNQNVQLFFNKRKELAKINTQMDYNKKAIENFQKQLDETNSKISGIKSRLQNVSEAKCPVCASTVTNPTVSPCCRNVFCLHCLVMSMEYSPSKNECPICRSKIQSNQLTVVGKTTSVVKNSEASLVDALPTKNEKLLKLIMDKPDGRFLIFSEYEGSFENVFQLLKVNNIPFTQLMGRSSTIMKTIADYEAGTYKVLLLNAKHFGSGLNLQMTSDIIIYHRMPVELEKQVIGRGQRMGRVGPLNVHFLAFQQEYQTQSNSQVIVNGETNSED